jgi:hypothetical protein
MHSAKIEHSERLQRVYNTLKTHGKLTTMEIIKLADVCAVNSIISELRRNNINITCTCLDKGKFEYELVTGGSA